MAKMSNKKAFTLIELLVVIAIIAILAAILFPVFAQAREKARQIACASNLKQLVLACIQYQEDYDETYPIGNSLWDQNGNWTGNGSSNWAVAILPYIKANGVYACPDDPDGNTLDPTETWAGLEESYAANGFRAIWNGGPNLCDGLMCAAAGAPVTDSQVNEPASVIAFAEMHSEDMQTAAPGGGNGNYTAWFNNVVSGDPYYVDTLTPNTCGQNGASKCGTTYPNTANGNISVHADGLANFAFADGHVKAMHPAQTVPNTSGEFGQWYQWGVYDNGASDGQPSMWLASHD